MILFAVVLAVVSGLLAYVGHRFELAARAAAAEGAPDAAEAQRLYRTQRTLLYVVAAGALLLAFTALVANVAV